MIDVYILGALLLIAMAVVAIKMVDSDKHIK